MAFIYLNGFKIGIIILALLLAPPISTTNTTASAQTETKWPNATDRPAIENYTVAFSSLQDGAAVITVQAKFKAESTAEALRAENESLTFDWHEGPNLLEQWFDRRDDSNDSLTDATWTVSRLGAEPPAAGDTIVVEYTVTWRGFLGDDDRREVIGPNLSHALSPGDQIIVRVPPSWSPSEQNAHRTTGYGEAGVQYEWTVGSGDTAHITFQKDGSNDAERELFIPNSTFISALILIFLVLSLTILWRKH